MQFPDLAFDFFGMCTRYLRMAKKILFSSSELETLLDLWKRGIGVEHKEAAKTHSGFFQELIITLSKDVKDSTN
jgi:hypothetical protein